MTPHEEARAIGADIEPSIQIAIRWPYTLEQVWTVYRAPYMRGIIPEPDLPRIVEEAMQRAITVPGFQLVHTLIAAEEAKIARTLRGPFENPSSTPMTRPEIKRFREQYPTISADHSDASLSHAYGGTYAAAIVRLDVAFSAFKGALKRSITKPFRNLIN